MSEVYKRPEPAVLDELADIATKLRIHSVRMTQASNSGHPTSCASIAEIMSVLFFQTMRYHVQEPRHPANDRFILSKGHAAPILYAAWAEAGLIPREELLQLRKIESDLEGHPTPRLNFIDVATGSLGQGLSCGVGMAWVGKYLDKADYRVFCVIGDGESAEGSVWEAMAFASHHKLDNLVAIFDVNRLGQSEPTSLQHDMDTYMARVKAFGWHAILVDGHDVGALCDALAEADATRDRPTCLVAKTFKGQGFGGIADQENWHGKPLAGETERVLAELSAQIREPGVHRVVPKLPLRDVAAAPGTPLRLAESPAYALGQQVATRAAYGTALAKLGRANAQVIGMDGDTKNSTFSIKLKEACPDRFIECFIAEQNLVGVGVGAACRDRAVAFVSTFAAFFTRAFDQLRMAAISQSNVNLVGSHAGCSIGEDGPSQMALEDLAMFRSIPGATVFYPSDAVSCERAVELAANTAGVCFIRTGRPNQAVLYGNEEPFAVGRAKLVRSSAQDRVLLIGAGVTLTEALKAADMLTAQGVAARVLDPFTVKPLDAAALLDAAEACGRRVVVAEDHYPEGGLGEAVASVLAGTAAPLHLRRLAVQSVPRSGKCAELMRLFEIDAEAIAAAALQLLKA